MSGTGSVCKKINRGPDPNTPVSTSVLCFWTLGGHSPPVLNPRQGVSSEVGVSPEHTTRPIRDIIMLFLCPRTLPVVRSLTVPSET